MGVFGFASLLRTGALIAAATLLGSAMLGDAPAQAAWPFDRFGDEPTQGRAARAAALLSAAVRIPTDERNESALADLYLEQLDDAGIETQRIDTPGEGRAAAWARVPGNGSRRPIILLSHLDVVAADPAEWSEDPYAGRIEGDTIHGRGSLDAKGVSIVHLMTLLAVAERDTPLERDVIFLATPDEETGGAHGAGYLARQKPEWLREAEYLLTEGGGILPKPNAATPSLWGVTALEKSPCWVRLSTRGTAGHSSTPGNDRAVDRLVAALDRIRRIETPLRVVPEVARMFRGLAAVAAQENQAGYGSLAVALDEDTAFRRRFLRSAQREALVRNTVAITRLQAGTRTNVLPGRAFAELDARLLPGESCDDFTATLERVIDDSSVAIEVMLAYPSQGSPVDTPLFHALERAAARVDPGALVNARVSAGFTDAHWFRERGIVAYGFVPRALSAEDSTGIHGPNERASMAALDDAIENMMVILEELAGQGRAAADAGSTPAW